MRKEVRGLLPKRLAARRSKQKAWVARSARLACQLAQLALLAYGLLRFLLRLFGNLLTQHRDTPQHSSQVPALQVWQRQAAHIIQTSYSQGRVRIAHPLNHSMCTVSHKVYVNLGQVPKATAAKAAS